MLSRWVQNVKFPLARGYLKQFGTGWQPKVADLLQIVHVRRWDLRAESAGMACAWVGNRHVLRQQLRTDGERSGWTMLGDAA